MTDTVLHFDRVAIELRAPLGATAFGSWIGMSLVIVGHCHVALAAPVTDSAALATLAQLFLRYPSELKKPSGERLEEFRDSKLPSLRLQLLSAAPVYPDLEEAVLADWLQQAQAALAAALAAGGVPQAGQHLVAAHGDDVLLLGLGLARRGREAKPLCGAAAEQQGEEAAEQGG